MKVRKIKRNPVARALSSSVCKPKTIPAKRGKGSYNRKDNKYDKLRSYNYIYYDRYNYNFVVVKSKRYRRGYLPLLYRNTLLFFASIL